MKGQPRNEVSHTYQPPETSSPAFDGDSARRLEAKLQDQQFATDLKKVIESDDEYDDDSSANLQMKRRRVQDQNDVSFDFEADVVMLSRSGQAVASR